MLIASADFSKPSIVVSNKNATSLSSRQLFHFDTSGARRDDAPVGESTAPMRSNEIQGLWEEAFEAQRSKKFYRTLAVKHPIVKRWLREDARKSDPATNRLFFLYRPRWRNKTRMRRLRIFNALLWALDAEGFHLVLDNNDRVLVVFHWYRAHVWILEETIGPVLPMTPSRSNLTGRLICQMDAKLPGGVKQRWEDEPAATLESQMPNILATFAVWNAINTPAIESWYQEQRAAMLHFPKTD